MSEVNCARISGRSKILRFLFYILVKADSHVVLQVSYRCMRVTVLNYLAHLIFGFFFGGVVLGLCLGVVGFLF